MSEYYVSLAEVIASAHAIIQRHGVTQATRIWGVPRGGVPVALLVHGLTGAKLVSEPDHANLIVDDIYDSGRTAARYPSTPFVTLFDKRVHPWAGRWLIMPWERSETTDDSATDAITRLLQYVGEDPAREGLRETPARVLRAFREEWCSGYGQDPAEALKIFTDGAERVDELIVMRGIPIHSLCEHHLAPFWGTAVIGYIPDGRIAGLSKLVRLANIFARRLQVQERLTNQIAEALEEHLKPKGVGVVLECRHMCMESRGVRTPGTPTLTSALRGALYDDPRARAEFLALRGVR